MAGWDGRRMDCNCSWLPPVPPAVRSGVSRQGLLRVGGQGGAAQVLAPSCARTVRFTGAATG
eukprot:7148750-Alexandrium_andersonii.AAC.1